MPLYEFECEDCGTFEMFRPISQASAPACCPSCEAEAMRIFSIPATSILTPLQRTAATRNEKASHAPHVCKTGCGCSGRRKAPPKRTKESDKLGGRTRHAYTGSRPWVIEHR